MLCSNCNLEMPPDDRFCEECGTPLGGSPATPEPDAAEAAVQQATGDEPPCARCGASASLADEEGYCMECGFRRERPREHTEIEISRELAGVTDQGKRHDRNEDNLALARSGESVILILCDGVSSSQDASAASHAAASAALASLEMVKEGPAEIRIRAAFREAYNSVAALPYSKEGVGDPPSTTFVAAIVEGESVTLAWAGDSRAYWISDSSGAMASRQLTVDDSWLNEMVSEGKLSQEVAEQSDKAHAITKWIGADAGEPEPSVVSVPLSEPGMLLLCTDGLWNYAESAEELAAIGQTGSALEIARRLVEFANEQGGRDNITAAVYQFQHARREEPAQTEAVSAAKEPASSTPAPVEPAGAEQTASRTGIWTRLRRIFEPAPPSLAENAQGEFQ